LCPNLKNNRLICNIETFMNLGQKMEKVSA
jgi:hypothetical protein